MNKSKKIIKPSKRKVFEVNIDVRYSSFAPKFKYIKSVQSTTRKTSRIQKDQDLIIGSEIEVLNKSRSKEFGKYPQGKPLQGYKRVFAGYGKIVKKGRIKRGTGSEQFRFKTKKPMKRKFTPFGRTYGYQLKK